MGAAELLALSLGLSVAVAALGWIGGEWVERASADPRLRERVWSAALLAPIVPPLLVGLVLLTPPPVREVVMAGQSAMIVAAPVAFTAPAAAAAPALVLDMTVIAWSVIALAGGLTGLRLASLAWRAARLGRLIRRGADANASLADLVGAAARDMKVAAPLVTVSAEAAEPLLAGLGRPRLILPADLAAAPEAPAVRAMIAHELGHLKRGDHRALWVEEALLAALAINPLMPSLRSRRSAAREEACDALALAGAAPETRRAYAQILIEALRSRAAPQGPGALPVLTFTGAGRTTAMHRLKAVVTPAAPAGRKPRLLAAGVGAVALALAAAGSVAVAAQREPTLRAFAPLILTINGERVYGAEILPTFRWVADSAHVSEGPGPRRVDLQVEPVAGAPKVSINGVAFPAGVTTDIVHRDDVERIETLAGGDLNIVLKQTGPLVRSPRTTPQDGPPVAEVAADAARNALSPEQRERYQRVSAHGYRDLCASNDLADNGFCAGVMLAQRQNAGVCPTAEAAANTGPGIGAYVERGRQAVRRLSARRDEGAHEYAGRAMAEAFPCTTGATANRAETAEVVVWMPVELEGRAALGQGDLIHVALTDAAGTLLAESLSTGEDRNGLRIPLTRAQFPGLGQGNRAYTLTGEIRRADGSVERAVEPATVRLGPGSERTARNLRPSLAFQPTPGAARTSPSVARRAEIASLRFDVTAASPILAKEGDVLKVWIDGPFESGARTTRTLSVPLAGGPFQPISTQVDVAAPARGQGADFVYRAEIVDRDGRKTHETHSPALMTVRGRSAVATPRLMPVG